MPKAEIVKLPKNAPTTETGELPTAVDFLALLGAVTRDVAGIAVDKNNTPTDRTRAAAVAGTLALKGIEAVERAQAIHDAQRKRAIAAFEPSSRWNKYCDEPEFNPFASVEYAEAVQMLIRDAKAVGLHTRPQTWGKPFPSKPEN